MHVKRVFIDTTDGFEYLTPSNDIKKQKTKKKHWQKTF